MVMVVELFGFGGSGFCFSKKNTGSYILTTTTVTLAVVVWKSKLVLPAFKVLI